jgi:hypothetical protein
MPSVQQVTLVIKSDTRVPFAGITISLSALMHGTKLKEGAEEGYVIVSRSLSSRMAGCHVGTSKRVQEDSKNEILLGVNIMSVGSSGSSTRIGAQESAFVQRRRSYADEASRASAARATQTNSTQQTR